MSIWRGFWSKPFARELGNLGQDSCPTPVAKHVGLPSSKEIIHSILNWASPWGLKGTAWNNYSYSSWVCTKPGSKHLLYIATQRSRYYIIPVLDLRGLRPREGEQCAQGRTVNGGAETGTHTIWLQRLHSRPLYTLSF